MEVIHNRIYQPWSWIVVAGTALWCLLVLPVSIGDLRNKSRLRPHLPDVQKVQAKVTGAIQKKDLSFQQITVRNLKGIYCSAGAIGDGS